MAADVCCQKCGSVNVFFSKKRGLKGNTMNAPSMVFLSSTTADLKEFRAAAREAVEGSGCHCVWMEGFNARSDPPEKYIEGQLSRCDAVVLIIGPCYGTLVPNHQISFTELEYKLAVKLKKQCLVFFTKDDFPVPANVIVPDRDRNGNKQESFRTNLKKDHVLRTFERPEGLKALVAMALAEDSPSASSLPCVVLCGGRASRLAPLTRDTCKEAIPVAGKSTLERILLKLDADRIVTSVIVSVGKQYEEQIRRLVDQTHTASPVRIVPNTCPGPLDAVLQLSTEFKKEPLLMIGGDNIIEADINHFVASVQAKGCSGNLLYEMSTGHEASHYGVGLVDEATGLLRELREKQEVPSRILISTACYYFLYEDIMQLQSFLNDPTVASQNIGSFISWILGKNVNVAAHLTSRPWFDVGTRHKLLRANAHYLRDRQDGFVEEGCQVKGPAVIAKGARVTGNCVVGPNVYIGRDVVIEGVSEVRNSIVMDGARIRSAGVSNSVIGKHARVQGLIESFIVCNGAHVIREHGIID